VVKIVPLEDKGPYKAKEVFTTVLAGHPSHGMMDVDNMRKRIKLMDKLDAANGSWHLEDAEHEFFAATIKTFPFGVANRDLLSIIDNALGAKDA
jgi:hypothetical protein